VGTHTCPHVESVTTTTDTNDGPWLQRAYQCVGLVAAPRVTRQCSPILASHLICLCFQFYLTPNYIHNDVLSGTTQILGDVIASAFSLGRERQDICSQHGAPLYFG
jgi:hypothetical protein